MEVIGGEDVAAVPTVPYVAPASYYAPHQVAVPYSPYAYGYAPHQAPVAPVVQHTPAHAPVAYYAPTHAYAQAAVPVAAPQATVVPVAAPAPTHSQFHAQVRHVFTLSVTSKWSFKYLLEDFLVHCMNYILDKFLNCLLNNFLDFNKETFLC